MYTSWKMVVYTSWKVVTWAVVYISCSLPSHSEQPTEPEPVQDLAREGLCRLHFCQSRVAFSCGQFHWLKQVELVN